MKFLFDSFPVIAFFIAYYIPDDASQRMFVATGAAIVAVIVQVSLYWLWRRRVEKMHLAGLVLILVLGGATLLTEDKRFFLWKPTAVNWVFALVFLASEWIGEKTLIQRTMGHAIELPARVWVTLNRSWVAFFTFLGAANLYVAFRLPEHIWVNFKLFGMIGLTFLFAITQAIYLSRHLNTARENEE